MKTRQRILIKLSGGALKGLNDNIFNVDKLNDICSQMAKLHQKYDIGIVIGGGNIWRGVMDKNQSFSNEGTNYIGMLATVMNGIALKEILNNHKLESVLFSAIDVNKVTESASIPRINECINSGKIAIFVAGTGYPYFTTDTTAALRALDMKANIILMAKEGTPGIFSNDPKIDKKAQFYDELTFGEILNKKLKVMDLTTLTLCQENNLNMIVFNINEPNAIIKAMDGKCQLTRVHK